MIETLYNLSIRETETLKKLPLHNKEGSFSWDLEIKILKMETLRNSLWYNEGDSKQVSLRQWRKNII